VGAVNGDSNGLLKVEVTVQDARSVCVAIGGELDISNVDILEQKIVLALEQRPTRLIIDASDLRFADSSGIALWVRVASRVDQFELRNPSPLLRRVLSTMGLSAKLRVS
jgi:anti-anti-sigma factor